MHLPKRWEVIRRRAGRAFWFYAHGLLGCPEDELLAVPFEAKLRYCPACWRVLKG